MATTTEEEQFKVAIIGGGIGGAATAYYLRKMFGSQVAITLFEQSGRIGGRIKSISFAGKEVEAGASVFLKENTYMTRFAQEFDVELENRKSDSSRVAFYDGVKEFTYSTLNFPSLMVRLRLAFRYGFPFFALLLNTTAQIYAFSNIYHLQTSGKCFTTPAELLNALHPEFVEMTKWTYEAWLRKHHSISERLINELLYGLVSNNYCQDLNVHAFVGFITLATMSGHPMSAKNGLQAIPKNLVESALSTNPNGSPKNFIPAQVTKISSNTDGKYVVQYEPIMTREPSTETFDYVVIAAPLHQQSELQADDSVKLPSDTYHEVDRTFLAGDMKVSAFGVTMASIPAGRFPFIIPTQTAYLQKGCLFRTMAALQNPPGDNYLWTAFSEPRRAPDPLRTIGEHYLDVSNQEAPLRISWLAYPTYKPVRDPHKELGTFVLAPRLYYVNAIERIASCMEMSIIGGRNVALLIGSDRNWRPKLEKIS